MRSIDTKRYKFLLELTESQTVALEALENGASHLDAAKAAGVHRITVTRWCNHHPEFIAERNRRQIERAARIAVASDAVTMRAIEVVSEAIEGGDAAMALRWLRLIGTRPVSFQVINAEANKPVTAEKIIDGVAETKSLMSPLEVFRNADHESAMISIAADLVE